MKEVIYISNHRNNTDIISDYISMVRNNSRCSFSSVHKRDHILQIKFKQSNCLDPAMIQAHKLTCVIENDLFRTVYIDGQKVMWESRHN